MSREIRKPELSETAAIAALWHTGWHDAHRDLVPGELTAIRTLEKFVERVPSALADMRVAGPPGAPQAMAVVNGEELNQFYVAREARGTGLAALLLADVEARLRHRGTRRAWLACAIGNVRAARFYEKHGWQRACTEMHDLTATGYDRPFEVWRYEKTL